MVPLGPLKALSLMGNAGPIQAYWQRYPFTLMSMGPSLYQGSTHYRFDDIAPCETFDISL
jgi:hypothetical protein